jgi:hypothetical protein
VTLLIASLACGTAWTRPQPDHEGAVYRVALDFVHFNELAGALAGEAAHRPPDRLVVADATTLGHGWDEGMARQLPLGLQYLFPAADREVIDAFLDANRVPGRPRLGALRVPVDFVSAQETDSLFAQGAGGWDRFRERYPDASGITSVSRVGFNHAYTLAMVYVGTQADDLAGQGLILLLARTDDRWRVLAHQTTWMS